MTDSRVFRAIVLFVGCLTVCSTASAQVSINADFVSRYVWRGFDFGESFSVQPELSYSTGAFTIGTWASYSIAADGAGANEHDLYASYSAGPVTVGLTDFYFPAPPGPNGVSEGAQFFNYDSNGEGAHFLEPSIRVTAPAPVPLRVFGSIVAYNAPSNPIYLEAIIPFAVHGVEMDLSGGGVIVSPDNRETPVVEVDAFYGLPESAVTKVALSATKALQVTDSFELPVRASFTVNPYTERTFLVLGLSITP